MESSPLLRLCQRCQRSCEAGSLIEGGVILWTLNFTFKHSKANTLILELYHHIRLIISTLSPLWSHISSESELCCFVNAVKGLIVFFFFFLGVEACGLRQCLAYRQCCHTTAWWMLVKSSFLWQGRAKMESQLAMRAKINMKGRTKTGPYGFGVASEGIFEVVFPCSSVYCRVWHWLTHMSYIIRSQEMHYGWNQYHNIKGGLLLFFLIFCHIYI